MRLLLGYILILRVVSWRVRSFLVIFLDFILTLFQLCVMGDGLCQAGRVFWLGLEISCDCYVVGFRVKMKMLGLWYVSFLYFVSTSFKLKGLGLCEVGCDWPTPNHQFIPC